MALALSCGSDRTKRQHITTLGVPMGVYAVAVMCQVKNAREWIELHLAHLMRQAPAGYTQEQQRSCERLHLTATYIIDVS